MHNQEDINLKDLILKLRDYKQYLFLNKYYILMITALFGVFGILGFVFSDDEYDVNLTFIVEEESGGGMNLGAMSGIASTFGFDIAGMGSTGTFSQSNIIELLKSRQVISNTLMQRYLIDNKKDFLIEHYLSINEIRDDLDEKYSSLSFNDKLTLKHDSLINIVWIDIVDNYLSIDFQSVEANIISLTYSTSNSEFGKYFVEELISQMSKMYVRHKTAQSQRTLDFVSKRADSVFFELENAEKEYARVQDINQRIVKAAGRLKELQLFRQVEVLNAMYLELVKNLEISKLTLQNDTPIINIIDKPILPLKDNGMGVLLWVLLSFFLGFLFSCTFFLFKKLFSDALLE